MALILWGFDLDRLGYACVEPRARRGCNSHRNLTCCARVDLQCGLHNWVDFPFVIRMLNETFAVGNDLIWGMDTATIRLETHLQWLR